MTKKKRSIWDDLAEVGQEILDRVDDILNPERRKQREPARVPVPVRDPHAGRDRQRYDNRR